eukprot:CAMPEP_0202686174 /NCGR_PEP_ID=MMETSP1385-20130828/1972_1 /ASSEMBLY_ACC=CAM_ASM_000861 /TAXON_ID=933848 /ORGANISM="Elphidium margaritaceum" /LENGTH=695 /DNA_ID=CAMNT_0049340699 /DNA_START=83 /DNA_END=2167 /DNA_ORIENTATION=-
MGYDERYISRAIKIHQKSKFGTEYNLSLLVEIIDRLKKKDETKDKGGGKRGSKKSSSLSLAMSFFQAHFNNANEAMEYVRTHHAIDFRFENGRYILCKIIDKQLSPNAPQQTRILLHPASQPLSEMKHNKYCAVYTEFHRLAPQKSVTLRSMPPDHPLSSIQVDDLIDFNPMYKKGHEGWKHGQIIKLDGSSSQVKVMYYAKQENHSYWVHLENKYEAALHNTQFDPLKGGMMQSFNEYTDVHPLKRYTSLDAIDNAQLLRQDKQEEKEIVEQLENFGYERPQILHALAHVPNASDINAVIEYMMNRKNKVALEGDEGGNVDAHNVEFEIDYSYIVENKGNEDIHVSNFEQQNLQQPKHNMGDFDNQLSSLAMGNELVMDDIIAQMELGDDGQDGDDPVDNVHETPMGPTPMGPSKHEDDHKMNPNAPVINQAPKHNPNDNPLLNGGGVKHMPRVVKAQPKAAPVNHKKKFWNFGRKKNKKTQNKKSSHDDAAEAADDAAELHQVFGVDAATLNGTRIADKDYQSEIPDILIKLKGELFVNGGHEIEGIFRVAPQKEACKRVQDTINKGNAQSINFRTVKGEIIANLIKLFYRQLPRNILQTVVDNSKIEQCTDEQRAAQLIMQDIGEPQKSYLLWLLDLCCDIIAYESVNKMNVKAISVVIAPNLFDASNMSNPMKVMTLSGTVNDFMQYAILW